MTQAVHAVPHKVSQQQIVLIASADVALRGSLKFMLEAEGYCVETLTRINAVKQHPLLKRAGCLILHPADNFTLRSPEMETVMEDTQPKSALSPCVILIVDSLNEDTRKRTADVYHCRIVEMPLLDAQLIDAVRASFMRH